MGDDLWIGVGVCFSLVPAFIAFLVALTARSRAAAAQKKAEELQVQLEVLRKILIQLRKDVPAAGVVAPLATALAPAAPLSPAAVSPAAISPAPPQAAPPSETPQAAATAAAALAAAKVVSQLTASAPATDVTKATSAPEAATPAPLAAPAAGWTAATASGAPTEPVPPTRPAPPPKPTPPPAKPFEWEKWIGVRGAAVLGGLVFALAGLYLFRYSVSQGWISPAVRVAMAVGVALAALVGSQYARAKYTVTANALSAGGIVVLYAAFWASKAMYDLVPFAAAFVLMVMTTAVAGLLAVRQHNRLAAYLGLVGGFLTPILLSRGQNAPIALFGYVFILDVALLAVAYLRRWSSVAALALGGTVLVQAGWVFTRMQQDQVWIAFGVLAIFAVLFAAFSDRFRAGGAGEAGPAWRVMQLAGLLTPALFLLYFAWNTPLQVPLLPTGGFLAMLTLGAGFVHRRSDQGEAPLLHLAGASSVLVLLTGVARRPVDELGGWVLPGLLFGVALAGHLNAEWKQAAARRAQAVAASLWGAVGLWLGVLVVMFRAGSDGDLPFLVVAFAFTLLMLRLAGVAQQPTWQAAAALGLALSLAAHRGSLTEQLARSLTGDGRDAAWTLGPEVLGALLLAAWARFARGGRTADVGVLTFAGVTLLCDAMVSQALPMAPVEVLVAHGLVVLLAAVSTLRARLAPFHLALVGLFAFTQLLPLRVPYDEVEPWAQLFFAALPLMLLLFGATLAAGPVFYRSRWAPIALGAVTPLLFAGLLRFWREAWGLEFQGVLPVALAALTLGAAALVSTRRLAPGRDGMVWLLAAASVFLAVAVPLQLDKQWITLSWALMALAHTALWKRFDHQGLKYLALALFSAVAVRLVFNPWVLEYEGRGSIPVLNWLSYTYLVPAACLGVAAWLFSPLELPRVRGFEKSLYPATVPLVTVVLGIWCALVLFAWSTLSVFDFFATGPNLSISLDRMPARDLALSLTWIVYSVVLLAIGMWRASKAMRWMSLLFLLVSIGKVFLYDLGELKDLYRVASLMGLAVSLIVISFAYQRFVFRRSENTPS
ncbi:MAG: DUF2339 domain-containing protein [Myxococcaceae bacterium]|nr:DUF2339 domain-containing protein [Myxococcaceae bacterium]